MPRVPQVQRMLIVAVLLNASGATLDAQEASFNAAGPAEAFATITVRCDRCDWGETGREAVMLRVTLDERYALHVPIARPGRADYRVMLGSVGIGSHRLQVEIDADLTARDLRKRGAVVERITVDQVQESAADYQPLALAPFVHARPDTVGHFTDVPLLMWYEVEPTLRGRRYRYSMIFTNEDGGTPADRLMATWGRTTDIEYLYSVEVNADGTILTDDMQGPDHEILPFRGAREGRHPLLWVSTLNNMVLDMGATRVRYAPAPIAFPLVNVSREVVMDAHPWLYAVASHELAREGKIAASAPPGEGKIPDPRRYLYLEACGEVGDAAVAFAVHVGDRWIDADRGLAAYRITRDGCYRAAAPMPESPTRGDVRAIRFTAFERSDKPGRAPARVSRVNTLFMLDPHFVPGPSMLNWQGSAPIVPGGPPLEIPLK